MSDENKKLILLGIISLIVLYIVYKILTSISDKIGITESTEKKEADSKLIESKFFEPDFFKGETGFKPLGESMAKVCADNIYDAIGARGWGGITNLLTDDNKILSTFATLDNKIQISEVANAYKINHSKSNIFSPNDSGDLKADLVNTMGSSAHEKLVNLLLKLPDK